MRRAFYRVWQFSRVASPGLSSEEEAILNRELSPVLRALFLSAPRLTQHHALTVYRRLREGGPQDPDLLQAALLHDVGKREVRLWHRVVTVLLGAIFPGFLSLLAGSGRGRLLRGLYANLHHAEMGARLVEEARASPAVVRLVRLHGHPEIEDAHLQALRNVDEVC